MAKLTKEQQKFWDILRMPYNHTCDNCKWIYRYKSWSGTGYLSQEVCGKEPSDNLHCTSHRLDAWKWDGKSN